MATLKARIVLVTEVGSLGDLLVDFEGENPFGNRGGIIGKSLGDPFGTFESEKSFGNSLRQT